MNIKKESFMGETVINMKLKFFNSICIAHEFYGGEKCIELGGDG